MTRRGKSRGGRPRKARVTLPQFTGDHGTGTPAATAGTELRPMTDANGKNPNNIAQRYRRPAYTAIDLTMRQIQAAEVIIDAHCKSEMQSSGGELKERVQSSPKPDATIAAMVGAVSFLAYVMKPVRRSERPIVEHVLWLNKPLNTINRPRKYQIFRECLDRVADHMRY